MSEPLQAELKPMEWNARLHDDDYGTHDGLLEVVLGQDGTMCVHARHPRGQGFLSFSAARNPRVYEALMNLAVAIKLDNREQPQIRASMNGSLPDI